VTSHQLNLFADYFQFYIQDDEISCGDLSEAWSDEAMSRMLAVAPRAVGIGTVRNVNVPVSINLLAEEPQEPFTAYDHVTECSLEVKTGRIVVAGCTDYFPGAVRVGTAPGVYRVRAYYSGLASVSKDGLEGSDSYRLDLWPSTATAPRVLKQREA
jgi:hypothetical protein